MSLTSLSHPVRLSIKGQPANSEYLSKVYVIWLNLIINLNQIKYFAMKKNTLKIVMLVLLLGADAFTSTFAQAVLPAQNYWVVETNLKQRDYSLIRFYNQRNELVYEEHLAGIYLNISRPKHVKRLNLALQQVTDNTFATGKQKNVIASIYHR